MSIQIEDGSHKYVETISHTHRNLQTVIPGQLKWKYVLGSVQYLALKVVVDSNGTVYVSSEDRKLYAFSSDGVLKWNYTTEYAIFASPFIGSDGIIYVASSNLYAIFPNGSLKWICDNVGAAAPIAITGDLSTIYVNSNDIYAIWSDSGIVRWQYKISASASIYPSCPIIGSDATVYFQSSDNNIYALTSDGTLKWSYTTAFSQSREYPPVLDSDDTVYVGGSGNIVYAVWSSGSLKWTYYTGSELSFSGLSMGPDGTTIYASLMDYTIRAISTSGILLRTYPVGFYSVSPPAIDSNGDIYLGSFTSQFSAFSSNGSLKWTYTATETVSEYFALAVIGPDGFIYVGGSDNRVYAFYPSATAAPSLTPTYSPSQPTVIPTISTYFPTTNPSQAPSKRPTASPSRVPTAIPSRTPISSTIVPSRKPTTAVPSLKPTVVPSMTPTTAAPSAEIVFGPLTATSASISVFWNTLAISGDGSILAAASLSPDNIYVSLDSGVSWVSRSSSGSRYWNSLAINSDGSYIAAVDSDVGSGTHIFISSDLGVTWIDRTPSDLTSLSNSFQVIAMSSTGERLATTLVFSTLSPGSIYTSSDYGVSWIECVNAGSEIWSSVAISKDGTMLVASVYSGGIFISTDFGNTWIEQTSAGNRQWCKVIMMSRDGSYIITGVQNSGYVYTSSDSGASWVEHVSLGLSNWQSVAMSSNGKFLAVVMNPGYIYTSTNYGAVWNNDLSSSVIFPWSSVAMDDEGSTLAATVTGLGIFRSTAVSSAVSGSNSPTMFINSTTDTLKFCKSCACPNTYELEVNSCIKCPYPMQSNVNKLVPHSSGIFLIYDPCSVAGVGCSYLDLVIVLTILLSVFTNGLAAFIGKDFDNIWIVINLLVYVTIPFIDYLTNLGYLLSAQFFNVAILVAFFVFFLFVHTLFAVVLYRKRATTKFWISNIPSSFMFKVYSPLINTILNGVLFTILMSINLLFLTLWFLLGSFLYISNAMALPFISNAWLAVWIGLDESKAVNTTNDDSSMDIDFPLMNGSILLQVIFQSIPLLFLQLINNIVLDSWSAFNIVSVVFSFLSVVILISRIEFNYLYGAGKDMTPLTIINVDKQ